MMNSFLQEVLIGHQARLRRGGRATAGAWICPAVLLALLSISTSAFAETAYTALRVVGAKHGDEIFKRVLEVRGNGRQEPEAWKIALSDPSTTGGVTEVEVRNGRITKEGAPKKARPVSAPMNLELLNLDSDGVVAVINQENGTTTSAQQTHYALANDAESGNPVWTIKFQPRGAAAATSLQIAADTGEVIQRTGPPVSDDAQYLTDADPTEDPEGLNPTPAEGPNELAEPEQRAGKKRASPRSRESGGEGPAFAKRLVKRVGKPLRTLRRFLP